MSDLIKQYKDSVKSVGELALEIELEMIELGAITCDTPISDWLLEGKSSDFESIGDLMRSWHCDFDGAVFVDTREDNHHDIAQVFEAWRFDGKSETAENINLSMKVLNCRVIDYDGQIIWADEYID